MRAIDAADFNSCYGRFSCDPLDKALYNAICWFHTIPMVLRAIAPIRTCYELFWFYGDSFPWLSELLILRAKQMVLGKGWATPAQQEDANKGEVPTAPLDISNEIGSDFVILPEAEVGYTYQDLALNTEQLHQWGEMDKYANTAGTRAMTEPAKGRNRRKPETTDDIPTPLHLPMPELGQAG
jgi:hypothetical protein